MKLSSKIILLVLVLCLFGTSTYLNIYEQQQATLRARIYGETVLRSVSAVCSTLITPQQAESTVQDAEQQREREEVSQKPPSKEKEDE